MYNMVSQEDSVRKEQTRKEEEKCGEKMRLCICLCILCFACLLLIQAIISSVILLCCMDDEYDGPSLNMDDSSFEYEDLLYEYDSSSNIS